MAVSSKYDLSFISSKMPLTFHSTLLFSQISAWTLTTGFTLSFGALFSKTWRVYKIFLASRCNERVVSISRNIITLYFVCAVYCVDIISALKGYHQCIERVFIALEGYQDLCGGYHQCFGCVLQQ